MCVWGVKGQSGRMEDNGGKTEAGKNLKVLQKPVLRSISWSVDEHKVNLVEVKYLMYN